MAKIGMWARAKEIAAATPADRNRYVDLLRALSISAVVLGHWIMAAPFYNQGTAEMEHLLDIQPWSRWLTWLFQVMPVFFFVGGFSNGVSWDSAQRRGQPYSSWLESRMRRLLGPVVPLILLWIALGMIGYVFAIPSEMIRVGSQVALVPVWFLAIYFVIVMLVPLTRRAWHGFGFLSTGIPIALAVASDLIYFNSNQQWMAWFNYLFVWTAVHQLGYAWQQQRLGGVFPSLLMAAIGLISLLVLTHFGPYPLSLVGVPSQEISNTTPPKLPILALAFTQIGLLLSIEVPMRRWLQKGSAWVGTVLINGLIMPIFLWHSTVMILVIGACFWLLPGIFLAEPGTQLWWSLRPLWVLAFLTILLLLLPLFLGLERAVTGDARENGSITRIALAAVLMCCGLAMLAGNGITGAGPFQLNWVACLLPVVGGFIALFRTPRF